MPTTLIGFQIYWVDSATTSSTLLHQTQILYDTWDATVLAAKTLAAVKANEYCDILNKVDDMSFNDCLHFKNTKLFILVDEREDHQEFGSVWACPVFQN